MKFDLKISQYYKKKIPKIVNFELIFFSICWIFLWLSINAKPSQIYTEGLGFINGIRSIIPIFLFLPATLLFIKIFFKKKKKRKYLNYPVTILLFFLFYAIFQIFGGVLEISNYQYLENNYLIFAYTLLILILLRLTIEKNKNFYIFFISSISLFFIFALSTYYIIASVDAYFFNAQFILSKWMYAIHPITNEFFYNPFPRVTGMSRMIALMCIILFSIFLFNKNKFFKIMLFFLILIIISIIWAMQSRGTLICLGSSILILIFFNYKLSFIKKIFLLLAITIIPFYALEIISKYKIERNILLFYKNCLIENSNSNNNKICTKNLHSFARISSYVTKALGLENDEVVNRNINKIIKKKNNNKNTLTIENKNIVPENTSRFFEPNHNPNADYTSGRIEIWKQIFKNYNFKKIFGYGPQADRKLLQKKTGKFLLSSNASNLYVYAFICAGYFGFLCIILAIILVGLKISYLFFKKNNLYESKNIYLLTSSIFLIFFIVRSLIENSFAVFSIDAVIFFNSLLIFIIFLNKKKIKLNNPLKI